MKILLDTCCIPWVVSSPENLSSKAKELLIDPESEVFVSVISCAEIACASDRGLISLDRHWKSWFHYYIEINDWQAKSIDLDIMEEAYSLPEPFHQDPADRIIVATVRRNGYVILTADRKLLDYPPVHTAC